MTEQRMPDSENSWYFTFGLSNPLGRRVVIVDGEWLEARQKVMNVVGRDFSFQYSPADFNRKPALANLIVTAIAEAAAIYWQATAGMQPNHLSDVYGLSQSQGC